MKIKEFNKFVNESFPPIIVDRIYENVTVRESDIDWTNNVLNTFPTEKSKIVKAINDLVWESPEGKKPMAYALGITEVIKEFKIPKVDLVAYGGGTFGTKDEPGAAYSVFGVQGHYKNGTYKIFFVDGGNVITPIGGVRQSEIKESLAVVDGAEYTWARKHPKYKNLLKFLSQFPDNAQSWSQATQEIMDMAKTAREYHTEYDLDMLYNDYETNPDAPQPLNFREIEKPGEYNTQGKKYIIDTLDKMGKQAVDQWFDDYKHWIK